MDVRSLIGKTAMVTGAASGIGRETALAFARRGADLVLCDLNEAGLAEVADQIRAMGCEAFAQRVDVANREEMSGLATAVHERVEAVDILMNNAGVGIGSTFLNTTLEDWDWILGINLLGVVHGCHYFLPAMVRRGRGGHVVNVSSIAAFVAGEPLLAYSATKAAVLCLSEALRGEMRPHGIGVTAVCPGIINTPIIESARLRGEHGTPGARQRALELYRKRNYPPQRVAENILKAVQKNRRVVPISPEAWLLYYLKRFAPGLLGRASRRLNQYLQGPA